MPSLYSPMHSIARCRLESVAARAFTPGWRYRRAASLADLIHLAARPQLSTTQLSLSSFACGYAPERVERLLQN